MVQDENRADASASDVKLEGVAGTEEIFLGCVGNGEVEGGKLCPQRHGEELAAAVGPDGPSRGCDGCGLILVYVTERAPPCTCRLAVDGRQDVERAVLDNPPPCEVGHDVWQRFDVVRSEKRRYLVFPVGFPAKGQQCKELVSGVSGFGVERFEEDVENG